MSCRGTQEIPFERRSEGAVTVWMDPERVPPEGLSDLLHLPAVLEGLPGRSSRAAGRKTIWRWQPNWLAGRLVVRQYAHGGLLRGLWGTLFLSARPMLRELAVAVHAREHGVPSPPAVALRVERTFGPIVRAHCLTEEVAGAVDLLELSRQAQRGRPAGPRLRQELARAVAQTVGRMHESGIYHADLNLKNLLVCDRQGTVRVHVVDFKKACLRGRIPLESGLRNLLRLDRSIVKWPAPRRAVRISDRLRTLREYVRLRGGEHVNWKVLARQVRTGHRAHALTRKKA